MKRLYYNRHLNEGFNINGRELTFTDEHEHILNTH